MPPSFLRADIKTAFFLEKGINTVSSPQMAVNAGAYEVLLIAFGKEEHVVFTGFQAADLTSALALLEHLTSSE